MSHPICDACETVANCKRNGCIPLVKQPDALEVAGRLTNGIHDAKTCDRATALLRTQHAELSHLKDAMGHLGAALARKDALLRQALDALCLPCDCSSLELSKPVGAAVDAIIKELSQ